jgi:hypothetical protein
MATIFPQEIFLVIISVKGLVDLRAIAWLVELSQSSGIEPAAFWLVAQCLKQLRCPVHYTPPYVFRNYKMLFFSMAILMVIISQLGT